MASITLKNLPDSLYQRLKARAQAHRRSVNSEIIHCLETIAKPRRLSPEERLERLRAVRPKLDEKAIGLDELLRAVDEGRP